MGPACGKIKKKHQNKSFNFEQQSETEKTSIYQPKLPENRLIVDEQKFEVKSIRSEEVKSTKDEVSTPKPSSTSTKSSPPEQPDKIKKKKTRPELTQCLPIKMNPLDNIIYNKISSSELFNALAKENNLVVANKSSGKCEFLDLRNPDDGKRVFRSQYINAKKLKEFDEKTWKQFKILMDFKKLYMLSNETIPYTGTEANYIPKKIISLVTTLASNNIKLAEILVVIPTVDDFVNEFPFFENNYQANLQTRFLLPLILFDSADFPELPMSAGGGNRIFIQSLSAFESNYSISHTFYKENLGISHLCFCSSTAAILASLKSKNKAVASYQGIYAYDITQNKEKSRLQTKMLGAIEKRDNMLLVYDPQKKDILLEYILLVGELVDQVLGVGEELGRRYFQDRMPNLFKGRVSVDEKEEVKEPKRRKSLKPKQEEAREIDVSDKKPASRCDSMHEAFLALQKETSKNFILIEEIFEKLRFFLDNMIKNPEEQKYKTIKRDNIRLAKTIFLYENSQKIIYLSGFVETPDDPNKLSNFLDGSMLKIIKSDLELAYKRAILPTSQF